MLVTVPIVLIFSVIIAVFLNNDLCGRGVYRIIFFIPVIVSSGILPILQSGDLMQSVITSAQVGSGAETDILTTSAIASFLINSNIDANFVKYIMYAIDNILDIINSSGIQILIFLGALKSIPKSLYEASTIEGATAWENFWKITFPMITPQLLVNTIYTIIDSFVNPNNDIMRSINNYNFNLFQFGYGSAISWFYFIIIVIVLIVFGGVVSRFVLHYD